jgi:hypothetical protein
MKTSELTGDALDWAVAKCQPDDTVTIFFDEDGEKLCHDEWDVPEFNPSTDWSQGGPIIERECIEVGRQGGEWIACIDVPENGDWEAAGQYGPTLLIAAMRCYVQSKLGDDVERPGELK